MNFLNQPLRRWPFLAFILIQGTLILFGAINWQVWSRLGKMGNVIDAYNAMTDTIGTYRFFEPPVDAQLFMQIHADGSPVFDEVLGADLHQEAALRLVAVENVFLSYKNMPLLLELVSRHFFEQHPEYKAVAVSLGYYKVPSQNEWRSGERVTMRKTLEMTFRRSN